MERPPPPRQRVAVFFAPTKQEGSRCSFWWWFCLTNPTASLGFCLDLFRTPLAPVLVGGETFPEIDLAARGRECAEILVDIHSEYVRPTTGLYQIPMIWGENQITAVSPMSEAIAYMHEIENRPGVLKASIALGNPFADVPEMGASAYVVTEGNASLAQQYAKELGIYCTVRRNDWHDLSQATTESLSLLSEHGQNINLNTMTYQNLGRALYPFDEI